MITFEEFETIPDTTKKKIIGMIFGSNIKSELERIEQSILSEGEKSEFIPALLENIDLKYDTIFGKWYNVNALVYVSMKEFGIDPEEDNE